MSRRNRGQSIVEYAILLGVIIAALLIMQVFIKRGYQGGLKDSADKMGDQFSGTGTTIHQKRAMTGDDQVITEEVATGSVMGGFVSDTKNTLDNNAFSYTARSGGEVASTTESSTGTAATEKGKVETSVAVEDFSIGK